MELTKEQEKMLSGEGGAAIKKSIELIIKIGEINGAERLVAVKSAQIAGVSYYSVGDPIFSFLKFLIKGNIKVRIPSWLNPSGMDSNRWKEMGIKTRFAKKQNQILKYYESLGVKRTLTCTPYLIGNSPSLGEHIAWSESSAVIMANSFFGARTNREGGPSSLAAALTGYTGYYGFHLEENRVPEIKIKVNASLKTLSDFSAMGYWFGKKYRGSIPFFTKINSLTVDRAKMLGSAMAASGSVTLFHVANNTPESAEISLKEIEDKDIFTEEDKYAVLKHFRKIRENAELVTLGCPHFSLDDLKLVNRYLLNRTLKKNVDFWIFSSRKIVENKETRAIISSLEEKGIKVFTDTCMVVSPSVRLNYRNVITNSAKAAFYLTQDDKIKVNLASIEEIVESVSV